jgi:hypothetical protein
MSLDCCNSFVIELFVELFIEAHDLFELPYMVNIEPGMKAANNIPINAKTRSKK